jgi:hypothetical protein
VELVFFDGDVAVTQITAGVHEGDEFGGVLFKGITGKLLAVFEEGLQILEKRHFATGPAEFVRVHAARFAEEIGSSRDLNLRAVGNDLSLEVILIAAEPPVTNVILVEVLAGDTEVLDDGFVFHTVVEHTIDLCAKHSGEASYFAVAAGLGLAGLKLLVEVIFGGVRNEGLHRMRGFGWRRLNGGECLPFVDRFDLVVEFGNCVFGPDSNG